MQKKISMVQLCVYLLELKKQHKTKHKILLLFCCLVFLQNGNNCCTLNLIEFIHLTEDHVILYAVNESEEIVNYK